MGKRANNAPLILNELQGSDRSLPISADNPPMYMGEAQDSALSCNFGTDRIGSAGRGIKGNGSAYGSIPNIDFTDVSEWDILIGIDLSVGILNQSFFLSLGYNNGDAGLAFGIDNVGVLKVIIYKSGVDPVITIPSPVIGINEARIHYDGAKVTLYNNGIFIGDLTETVDLSGGVSNIGTILNLTSLAFKSGHIIHQIQVNDLTNDVILAQYNCEEGSGDVMIDSSGKGNNGDVVNLYAGFHAIDNLIPFSFFNNYGYTLSDGVSFYYDSAATQLIPSGVFIPRDESNPSKCVAYTAPAVQADLLVTGKAPSLAKIGNSPAWKGVTGSHYSIIGLLTSDTVEAFGSSAIPTIPVNGELHLVDTSLAYGVTIKRAGVEIGFFPFSEDIINAANHVALNASTVTANRLPNAALVNGSLANEGVQSEFHWGQLGYAVSDGINYYYDQALTQLVPISHIIPAYASLNGKCAAYTTGGVLADLTVTQDGKSFLNYAANTLEAFPYPRLVQADYPDWGYWFDSVTGVAIERQFTSFEANNDNIDFNDVSEPDKVKNSRFHKQQLQGKHAIVEDRIINL